MVSPSLSGGTRNFVSIIHTRDQIDLLHYFFHRNETAEAGAVATPRLRLRSPAVVCGLPSLRSSPVASSPAALRGLYDV
jgi:hypothetical protein